MTHGIGITSSSVAAWQVRPGDMISLVDFLPYSHIESERRPALVIAMDNCYNYRPDNEIKFTLLSTSHFKSNGYISEFTCYTDRQLWVISD